MTTNNTQKTARLKKHHSSKIMNGASISKNTENSSLDKIVMKDKTISLELFQEIVENNKLINNTIKKYKHYKCLKSKMPQLASARIRINAEMEGEGLRSTYVSIGREWVETKFVTRWKDEARELQKHIKREKLRRQMVKTCVPLFLMATILYSSVSVYNDIKPDFGDKMKHLRSSDLVFDDLSKFTNSIFKEIQQSSLNSSFSFINHNIPPELNAIWSVHLKKMQGASSLLISNILIDPTRDGVYHVKCNANTQHSGDVEFRLQCVKKNNKYSFIALE